MACEYNELVRNQRGMVLVSDEALYSWTGNNQWYGFNMWYEWGLVTEVGIKL